MEIKVTDLDAGKRIDNFLIKVLKGVPKSLIYRLTRQGKIRVNKKKVELTCRLNENDIIFTPNLATMNNNKKIPIPSNTLAEKLRKSILYEDQDLLVLNKPYGLAVHGGSSLSFGLIEALRQIFSQEKYLELAHRLDRDTSGCLIIAKKPAVLKELHTLLREGKVNKIYLALTLGKWKNKKNIVEEALEKNILQSGERVVKKSVDGKYAKTEFNVEKVFANCTLTRIKLFTGRTHQIRVHAKLAGHPIAGDEKYGDKAFNNIMKTYGLQRLFLHAAEVEFTLPAKKTITVTAGLPEQMQIVLKNL